MSTLDVVSVTVIAVIAFLFFGAFAIQKMNPDKFRVYAESRLAKIRIEISRSSKAEITRAPKAERTQDEDRGWMP